MKESGRILRRSSMNYPPIPKSGCTSTSSLSSSCNNAKRASRHVEARRGKTRRRRLMLNLLGSICRCCALLASQRTHTCIHTEIAVATCHLVRLPSTSFAHFFSPYFAILCAAFVSCQTSRIRSVCPHLHSQCESACMCVCSCVLY